MKQHARVEAGCGQRLAEISSIAGALSSDLDGFRQGGYVFWDADRLDQCGVLRTDSELIMSEYRSKRTGETTALEVKNFINLLVEHSLQR